MANLSALENGLSESQYCAYDPKDPIDPDEKNDFCQGNSGGPLQIARNPNWPHVAHIVGINSFDSACGGLPTVFTRIAYYAEWIANHVWPDEVSRPLADKELRIDNL